MGLCASSLTLHLQMERLLLPHWHQCGKVLYMQSQLAHAALLSASKRTLRALACTMSMIDKTIDVQTLKTIKQHFGRCGDSCSMDAYLCWQ